MCGICGLLNELGNENNVMNIKMMNMALQHRGPDDSGFFSDGRCALAMRRLSIIDLAGGKQPIKNEDGRLTIVFNGEIFNYLDLRADLIERGHHFRTQSDTEVIIHLYEEYGTDAVLRLNGQFAFCIYDKESGTLFLARDRFGEKPLYYFEGENGEFAFSSEVPSLLENGRVPRQIDEVALAYYLRVGMVPAPLTLFQHVRTLPPGHWLLNQAGKLTIESYFEVDYQPDKALIEEGAAVEAVETALTKAVQRQTMSDVPLGAFLSGGIDSSTVVAMLQAASPQPIKTFTVRFEEAAYDESGIARQVADHLGTQHHEITVPNFAFEVEDLYRVIRHVGLPFTDSSALPTYFISREIRKHVTVALSGDGGDEMFAGYPMFRWAQQIASIRRVPRAGLQIGKILSNGLGRVIDHTRIRRLSRGLHAALLPPDLLPIDIHTIFTAAETAALVHKSATWNIELDTLPLFSNMPPQSERWSVMRRLMYFRLRHNLPEKMLIKVDRMSMAASLEVRAPFLDTALADLSMRLPDAHLIQNGVGKAIVRKVIGKRLPQAVFDHPKQGFGIPLHRFQNEAYRGLVRELLGRDSPICNLLNPDAVQKIVTATLSQQSDTSQKSIYRANHQLWSLLQLAAWLKEFKVEL